MFNSAKKPALLHCLCIYGYSVCYSYEVAGRSTLDNSDIDLSKFGSLPKGPAPPKPTRSSGASPVSPRVVSPSASGDSTDAARPPQSQTAANLAELDDLLNTLNQHQQKFLSDGKSMIYDLYCMILRNLTILV